MTVGELATLLERYDRDELVYVVLAEHEDGELELVGWDGDAVAVDGRDTAREIAGWRLVPHDEEPVAYPCDVVARGTRLELLNACPRCSA